MQKEKICNSPIFVDAQDNIAEREVTYTYLDADGGGKKTTSMSAIRKA